MARPARSEKKYVRGKTPFTIRRLEGGRVSLVVEAVPAAFVEADEHGIVESVDGAAARAHVGGENE